MSEENPLHKKPLTREEALNRIPEFRQKVAEGFTQGAKYYIQTSKDRYDSSTITAFTNMDILIDPEKVRTEGDEIVYYVSVKGRARMTDPSEEAYRYLLRERANEVSQEEKEQGLIGISVGRTITVNNEENHPDFGNETWDQGFFDDGAGLHSFSCSPPRRFSVARQIQSVQSYWSVEEQEWLFFFRLDQEGSASMRTNDLGTYQLWHEIIVERESSWCVLEKGKIIGFFTEEPTEEDKAFLRETYQPKA